MDIAKEKNEVWEFYGEVSQEKLSNIGYVAFNSGENRVVMAQLVARKLMEVCSFDKRVSYTKKYTHDQVFREQFLLDQPALYNELTVLILFEWLSNDAKAGQTLYSFYRQSPNNESFQYCMQEAIPGKSDLTKFADNDYQQAYRRSKKEKEIKKSAYIRAYNENRSEKEDLDQFEKLPNGRSRSESFFDIWKAQNVCNGNLQICELRHERKKTLQLTSEKGATWALADAYQKYYGLFKKPTTDFSRCSTSECIEYVVRCLSLYMIEQSERFLFVAALAKETLAKGHLNEIGQEIEKCFKKIQYFIGYGPCDEWDLINPPRKDHNLRPYYRFDLLNYQRQIDYILDEKTPDIETPEKTYTVDTIDFHSYVLRNAILMWQYIRGKFQMLEKLPTWEENDYRAASIFLYNESGIHNIYDQLSPISPIFSYKRTKPDISDTGEQIRRCIIQIYEYFDNERQNAENLQEYQSVADAFQSNMV